jgi:PAS domain S-box-containing protein
MNIAKGLNFDILDAASDAILLVDDEGAIVFANKRVGSVFGYAPHELKGQQLEVLVPERFRHAHVPLRHGFMSEGRQREIGVARDLYGLHKDGSELPLEISLNAYGGMMLASIRDASAHKSLESQLAHEKALADNLVELAPAILLLLDSQGGILRANSYFEDLTGYCAKDLVGRSWFDTCVPDDIRPELELLFENAIDNQALDGSHINPIVKKDGTQCQVEWQARSLFDGDGQFVGLLNIGHDVTEHLAHETELREARAEADQENAAKSRFLAAASHDLRQPLQSMSMYLSVLAKQLQDPVQIQLGTKIRNAIESMSGLVESLLDISKLESGGIQPDIKDIALQDVFDRIYVNNQPQAVAKGLALACRDTGVMVKTDPVLLERVLENLVANAIRYTNMGSVTVGCDIEDGQVLVSVRDTGVGMSQNDLHDIFQEYFRLEASKQSGDVGLGLGLSIVKRIAQLLDHPIKVSSVLDQGSTFSIQVPLSQAALEAPAKCAAGMPKRCERKEPTLLFIDDDPAILDATSMFMETAGIDVRTAADGDEAMAQLAAGLLPDIVVSDYRLPRYSGVELVRRIKDVTRGDLPTIIMTGDTSASEIANANLNNCTILHKPVDTDELIALIERMTA